VHDQLMLFAWHHGEMWIWLGSYSGPDTIREAISRNTARYNYTRYTVVTLAAGEGQGITWWSNASDAESSMNSLQPT
jgi:hypothetical protein